MTNLKLFIAALFLLGAPVLLSACEGDTPTEESAAAPAKSATPAEAPAAPAEEAPAVATAEQPGADPIVATVNQAPITRQLLESQVIMAESGRLIFGDETADDPENPEARARQEAADLALRREVLSGLISLELACQEALKLGYAPADEELEAAFANLRNEYADPDQLHKVLDQYGETEDDLREQLRKTMALKKWQDNEFLAKVEISEAEAQSFYQANLESLRHGEMVQASQIFLGIPIASPPSAQEQALAQAQAAQKALNAGEAFEEVALRFSNDPDVAASLGNLGWLDRESSVTMFNESIFSLNKGEISDIVETPIGYYIFKVTDIREAGVEPFESAKPDIIEYLAEEQLTEAVRQRMLELEKAADIVILDPTLNTIMQTPAAAQEAAPASPESQE